MVLNLKQLYVATCRKNYLRFKPILIYMTVKYVHIEYHRVNYILNMMSTVLCHSENRERYFCLPLEWLQFVNIVKHALLFCELERTNCTFSGWLLEIPQAMLYNHSWASDRYLAVCFRLSRTTRMLLCCISRLLGWNQLWQSSED